MCSINIIIVINLRYAGTSTNFRYGPATYREQVDPIYVHICNTLYTITWPPWKSTISKRELMLCHSNRGFIVGSAVSWYQYYIKISVCLDKSSGTQYRICTQYICSVVGSMTIIFCSIFDEQTCTLIIYRSSYFLFPSEAVLDSHLVLFLPSNISIFDF